MSRADTNFRFRLSRAALGQLRAVAEAQGRDMSEIVRAAVAEYVERTGGDLARANAWAQDGGVFCGACRPAGSQGVRITRQEWMTAPRYCAVCGIILGGE